MQIKEIERDEKAIKKETRRERMTSRVGERM